MTRDEAIQFLDDRPADEPLLILPAGDPAVLAVCQILLVMAFKTGDLAGAEQIQALERRMREYQLARERGL